MDGDDGQPHCLHAQTDIDGDEPLHGDSPDYGEHDDREQSPRVPGRLLDEAGHDDADEQAVERAASTRDVAPRLLQQQSCRHTGSTMSVR